MGKRGLFLTFLVSLALLVAAWYVLRPGEPAPPVPPGESGTGGAGEPGTGEPGPTGGPGVTILVVEGMCLDRASHAPLPGARVALGDGAASTDPNGAFRLELPVRHAPARFVLSGEATAPGYLRASVGHTVPAGAQHVRTRPFRLIRAVAEVRGCVRDAEGRPLAGADVQGQVTGADGRYGPLPVGGGRQFLSAKVPGRPLGTVRFDVTPGATDLEVDIFIPESTPLAGRVLDDRGLPLSGATVSIDGTMEMVTGEDGAFSFPAVAGDSRQVRVTADGWLPAKNRIDAGREITVRLVRGAVIAGRVLHADGRDVGPGFRVVMESRVPAMDLLTVPTGEGGAYRMTVPGGGPVEISVRRAELPYGREDNYACGRFVVDVPVGATVEEDLRLPEPRILALTVLDAETDRPLPGVTVVGGYPDPTSRTVTGADGTAEVASHPATVGQVHLALLLLREGYLPLHSGFTPFEIARGEPKSFRLTPLGTVDVTVLDEDGTPVPGAEVRAELPEEWRTVTYSGVDGTVEVAVPRGRLLAVFAGHPTRGTAMAEAASPAKVTLRLALPPAMRPRVLVIRDAEGEPVTDAWLENSTSLERRAVDEAGRVTVPAGTRDVFVLAPGRQAVNVSVEDLSPDGENAVTLPPGRDLAVTVADSAGRGIRDVMVIAYSDGGGLVEVPREFTDSKGLAVLRGLPAAGSVFVKVSRHMYEGRTVWVAGGDTEARVALSPMSAIEVTLAGERPRAGQNLEFVLRAVDRAPEDEDQRLQRRATVPDESGVVTIVAPPGRVAFWFRCAEGGFKVYDELTVPEGGPARVVYDFPAPGRTVIQVVDSAGEPIEGARIFAADVHMHLGWTLSIGRTPAKKRGQMPTGSVPLAVAATGQPTIVTEPIFLAPGRTVRITLPKGERVGGILVSGEGSPVAGRLRLLTRVDEPEGWAETGPDGRFVLPWPVAPGDHDLEVRAPGFRPVRRTIHVAAGAKNEMEIAVE